MFGSNAFHKGVLGSMKKIFNLIKHPLFSGSAIMVLGSNSVNGLNYLYHLLIGRLLGPASYGELASLLSLIGLLGIIPGAINLVIIKYISAAKTEEGLSNLVSWLRSKLFKTSLVFCILVIIVSPAIASFLHINQISYLILIAISFLFSISSLLNRSILQGLLKFKELILSIMAENIVKLVLSVLLILLGLRVGGAMLALTVATTVGWYLTSRFLHYPTGKNLKILPEINSMVLYTFPVLIYTLATTSLYSSDLILVKHFFSSHDAGLYASLSTLGKIIFFGAGPIGSVMFPIVSKRHAEGLKVKKIFLYSFFTTLGISLSILTIYWFFPRFAVNLLYGSAYLESAGLLVWSGMFMSLFTLSSLLINFNLSQNRTKVVILPLLAAIAQITAIWIYHPGLFAVILISIVVTALLLGSLLIYSSYVDQFTVGHSPRL